MTDADSASYVEMYLDAHGPVIEVYLTHEDFDRARSGGVQVAADAPSSWTESMSEHALQAQPRVFVRQTVAPRKQPQSR